ncbi:phage antirepressor KilAC domain-containing protein [Thomasclavelia cocleata]|uniref:phage antirepressor KilAC domain-containing protein n=1 Tax=Thomasclavelia cocleata TaxID=69824 RepID=UPI0025887C64|nr:phage antirepressor KilAC domain-containing protein [Thomasclavelia cocleata]
MNELLKVNYDADRITLSARDLHSFLNSKERFSKWYERMVSYGFAENVDYRGVQKSTVVNNGAKKEIGDYEITLDMAKEIAMLQRNEKGKEARQYFIEVEKQWNSPERIIARGLIESQKMIDNLNQQLVEMKPKAEFFDAVADSKTAIPMADVAKVLNYRNFGRNNLFEFLRNKKILMNNNQPYQKYVDCGYFRVIEQKYTKPNGDTAINIKTLVYQKGVNYIKKLLDQQIQT